MRLVRGVPSPVRNVILEASMDGPCSELFSAVAQVGNQPKYLQVVVVTLVNGNGMLTADL